MNEQILKKIEKNLYEIETILSTDLIVSLLEKKSINASGFLKSVKIYQDNIEQLKNIDSEVLLNLLDEKLDYFVKNSNDKTHITLYHTQLAVCITFIESKMKTFFNNSSTYNVPTKIQEISSKDIFFLNKIEIKNFFSIKELKLEKLKDKKEIYIVGENGDGKTLLLQALTLGLKGIEEGDVFNLVKSQKEYTLSIEDSNNNIYTSKDETYKNFFAYGANRNNNCQMKEDETGYLSLFNPSLDLKNPIDWLKYLDHSEKAEKKNVVSVENAKKLLQELLESDVEITIEPDKVTFREKGSTVSFEQLSAGYKGVITIVADLLVRLSENQPYVENIREFKGVVVIDEVELHLHPKWKYSFVEKLRTIFPDLQFIMTTHSPTVLLGASAEAVFYKIYKEDGEVKISNQIANEGYTNNTLVSSPLFDLETVTSKNYDKKSISSDDYIYEKIHAKIAQEIKDESITEKERISKLIDEELAKI